MTDRQVMLELQARLIALEFLSKRLLASSIAVTARQGPEGQAAVAAEIRSLLEGVRSEVRDTAQDADELRAAAGKALSRIADGATRLAKRRPRGQ